MYNVRKCPKCGGNVPDGNAVCNNCGHKMSFLGGSSVIVGGSRNANTIPGGNPFESKKSNNTGCIVFFFIAIFFILPILSVFYEIYQEIEYDIQDNYTDDEYDEEANVCSDSCGTGSHKVVNNYCFCENGDIYDEDGYVEHFYTGIPILDNNAKCRVYCDEPGASLVNDSCVCSDGKYYDIEGNEITSKVIPNERSVSEWYMDSISGKDVVTVLCDNKSSYCSDYKSKMDDLASRREFNYYYFNLDLLTESEKNRLTKTYNLPYYESSDHFVPYLFVIRDNKFTFQLPGLQTIEYIENFFVEHEIIKE